MKESQRVVWCDVTNGWPHDFALLHDWSLSLISVQWEPGGDSSRNLRPRRVSASQRCPRCLWVYGFVCASVGEKRMCRRRLLVSCRHKSNCYFRSRTKNSWQTPTFCMRQWRTCILHHRWDACSHMTELYYDILQYVSALHGPRGNEAATYTHTHSKYRPELEPVCLPHSILYISHLKRSLHNEVTYTH